ncbi:hypothetical protein CRUP_016087 [Coryphaenoides rupestris]|nr:hypothetical protein CRUP_016087 [Coryphaenoides rupestris]
MLKQRGEKGVEVTKAEARALVERCLKVLYYRDARSYNRVSHLLLSDRSVPPGCAISYGSYVMPDGWVNSWLHQHYVPIAVGNTIFCTSLSCYSRFLELQFPQRSKVLRTGAFVFPFLFDTFPLFYRLRGLHLTIPLGPSPPPGHSHQLFHVCAVVGTHFQMEGVMADMAARRAWLVDHGAVPSFLGTVGALAAGVLLNLGIIAVFSAPLFWKPQLRGRCRRAGTMHGVDPAHND